jgi:hypothetical protein
MWEGKGWILALCLAAAGLALRVGAIGEFWVNGDEGLYDYTAHAPIALARIPIAHNAHPPLYFWLLRGVASFSNDFLWLRVPALAFGCLAILAMYRLGREVAGEVGGVAAAAFAAFSPGAIMLSQVIRPYALQNLLIVSALLFFFRYLRLRNRSDLTLYAVCMVVAVFIHYGSFLLPAAMAAFLTVFALARQLDERTLRNLCLANTPLVVAAALLYWLQIGPNLLGQTIQKGAVEGWLASQFAGDVGGVWKNFLGLFDYLFGLRLAGVAVIAFFAGLLLCVRDRRSEIFGLCLASLLVAVALSVVDLYPFGATRHSFHLAPLVGLPIVYGASWVAARGPAVAAALTIVAEPVATVLGFSAGRESPEPELQLPRREVDELRPIFADLANSRGLMLMDLETAYTLSPLLREADAWPRWFGSGPLALYRWGRRFVIVPPIWNMSGDFERGLPHWPLLGTIREVENDLPELARFIGNDVPVVSTHGAHVLESIRLLEGKPGRELVDEVVRLPNIVIFRLDTGAYRRVLAEQARKFQQRRRAGAAERR